jgi:hypothetical protein
MWLRLQQYMGLLTSLLVSIKFRNDICLWTIVIFGSHIVCKSIWFITEVSDWDGKTKGFMFFLDQLSDLLEIKWLLYYHDEMLINVGRKNAEETGQKGESWTTASRACEATGIDTSTNSSQFTWWRSSERKAKSWNVWFGQQLNFVSLDF